jgi:hypothetical protein
LPATRQWLRTRIQEKEQTWLDLHLLRSIRFQASQTKAAKARAHRTTVNSSQHCDGATDIGTFADDLEDWKSAAGCSEAGEGDILAAEDGILREKSTKNCAWEQWQHGRDLLSFKEA